jgi:pentalenolactone synthase
MPFQQPHPLHPAPELRDLQQRCPVHRVRTRMGDEAWLVTGYEEVRALYAGESLGRAHPRPERAARLTASALFGGRPRERYSTEDADRQWIRQVLHLVLGPARLRDLRPWLDVTVTELLDRFAGAPQPADFIDLVAVPLPTLVICKLLGVPTTDLARYRDLAEAIASAGDEQRSAQGLAELTEHLRVLIASGRVTADGLLGMLRAAPYRLPPNVVADIGAAMMFTGHHTTVVAIGYGVLLLMRDPEQRAALLAHPETLPAAVEECLRVGNLGVNVGGGNGIPTYAREDFDLGGERIRAGDLVLLDTGSANHDDKAFDDAFRFDAARSGNQHLTFGYGRHYCPGAGLARVEMTALFAQLLPRFPRLSPAVGLDELRAHDDQITGGLVTLPVRW